MKLITDALILRETNVGEADRFITALTREQGVLRAAARGVRRVKSRNAAATGMLAHSRLTLVEGRSGFVVTDAQPLHMFFGLRDDLQKLSLAQYFCELTIALCPREESAEQPLRLLLNALHFLSEGRDPQLLKSLVELRLLAQAGYRPALDGCAACGRQDGALALMPAAGVLCCPDCGNGLPLSPPVLGAMRVFTTAPLSDCFALKLPPAEAGELEAVSEAFLLAQLGRGFPSLTFYHQLNNPT